jgi:hypothetical protein
MIRTTQISVLIVCMLAACLPVRGGNTYFWLSKNGFPSPTGLPALSTDVPEFYNFNGQTTDSIYIWGRPDSGKTLKNWSLNLVCSDPNVLTFNSVDVFESAVTGVERWEDVSEPTGSTTAINNILGFTLSSGGGVGIGSSPAGTDLYQSADNQSWLLAKVNYTLKQPFPGYKSAQLFLQIGTYGVSNFTGTTNDVSVVLGHSSDMVLSPSNLSHRDSTHGLADALIKYFPNPDADFDNDLDVDGRDYLIWQRGYLTGTTNAQGNANFGGTPALGQDMVVNQIDLAAWQFKYGGPVPIVAASTAVPEPSALFMFVIGAAFAISGRAGIQRRLTCVTPGGEA